MAVCPHCHRENPVISLYCPACGGKMQEEGETAAFTAPRPVILPKEQLGMKWYKFLLFFSLPLSFIMNLSSLIDTVPLLKSYRAEDYLPGLETLIYGNLIASAVLTVLLLGLTLLAEWNLFKFRWAGVKALLCCYGINALYALLMLVLMLAAPVEANSQAAQVVRSFVVQFSVSGIGMIVMFFLNRAYFRKRRALFQPENLEN